MGANTAGIYGAQIFRRDDRPIYRRGFTVAISVLSFGLLLAIIRYIDDRIRRKRARAAGIVTEVNPAAERAAGPDDRESNGEKAPLPSSVQAAPASLGIGSKPVVSEAAR